MGKGGEGEVIRSAIVNRAWIIKPGNLFRLLDYNYYCHLKLENSVGMVLSAYFRSLYLIACD